MKKAVLILLILVLPCMIFAGGTKEEPVKEEAVSAVVEEDWDAIYEAAKEEGKVVIYALTSRIFDAVEEFKTMYPGIEVEAVDIPTVQQIEKLKREQAAGVYNADVLLLADRTSIEKDILKKGLAKNYVPATLVDGVKTEDVIPENYRKDILQHSIEAKVIFYNTDSYSQPPVTNLWDFTEPEWKGRFQMKDPMQSPENMNFLQMVVKHSDEMAAAYEKKYGKKIELSDGIENAGYEWLDRIVKNDIVLTTSDGKTAKAAGQAGQENAPLGICVASSKIRYNKKGTKLGIAFDVEPKFGIVKSNFLLMTAEAPHPNAAKLLIRYMLGDSEGGKGMAPFFVPGQWASRSDIKPQLDKSLSEVSSLAWSIDPDFVYYDGLKVRDFWLSR